MADYRCPYGYGWCEVPYKDCPHWQGTFCELDVEARWMEGTKVNENFEKIKGRLGEAEVLAQLAEECTELAQAALKLRRALDGKNPTPNTEEERRRALLEEYTDVIHCALVLDLDMDLDQTRKKTERWMKRLEIEENVGQ